MNPNKQITAPKYTLIIKKNYIFFYLGIIFFILGKGSGFY